MKIMKPILFAILSLSPTLIALAQSNAYVARFRGDKCAAVSFTFDDGDEEHATLVGPELEKRGFRGTFWVIGKKVDEGDSKRPRATWQQWKEMADKGHEISSHSYTHGKLVNMDRQQIERDIFMNDSAIYHNTGIWPVTFCYPYNATNPLVKELAMKNRVGTRTFQTAMGQERNHSTEQSLDNWLNNLLKNEEWSVTMIHGINVGYDKWEDPQLLWNLFDKVKGNEDKIWVDTFREISAYQEERDNTVLTVTPTENGFDLSTRCNLNKDLFNVSLTYVVAGDWSGKNVTAIRSGSNLSVEIKSDRLLITAAPAEQPIQVSW